MVRLVLLGLGLYSVALSPMSVAGKRMASFLGRCWKSAELKEGGVGFYCKTVCTSGLPARCAGGGPGASLAHPCGVRFFRAAEARRLLCIAWGWCLGFQNGKGGT